MDVYEYEDVTVYYANESEISGGSLDFKIEKSWLESMDYSAGDVVMLHYNENAGVWDKLDTSYTGEKDGYYCYSAETPSFSWFAIAASEDAATLSPDTQTVSATRAAIAAPTSNSSVSKAASTAALRDSVAPEKKGSWNYLLIAALIIIIAAVIIIVFTDYRKK